MLEMLDPDFLDKVLGSNGLDWGSLGLAAGFLRALGEGLGLVKPKTSSVAGIGVFEKLQEKAYQYDPSAFRLGPVSGKEAAGARKELKSFAGTLRARAAGQMPSQAELQLQAGQQRAQQSLQSALAGLRGRQAGLGVRGLQQQFAEQGQVLSQQAAQLRAAEQAGAEQQLAQFLAQRAQLEAGAQGLSLQEALMRQQALAQLQQLRGADTLARQQAAMGAAAGARQSQMAGLGGLLGAVGSIGASLATPAAAPAAFASDENLKTDIEPAKAEAKRFLDELTAYTFKYKNDDEPMMGVMAQDAEKSKMGKYLVETKKSKKVLNGKKTMSAMLASLAYLNDRVNELENK